MGEPDEVFRSFFSHKGEAAVLACDELGVTPVELLHLPKSLFYDNPSVTDAQAQLRYNMKERFRQNLFKKLFEARQKIVESGQLDHLWRERMKLRPEGPGVPNLRHLPAATTTSPLQQQQKQRRDESAFDTQSDSDEDDDKHFFSVGAGGSSPAHHHRQHSSGKHQFRTAPAEVILPRRDPKDSILLVDPPMPHPPPRNISSYEMSMAMGSAPPPTSSRHQLRHKPTAEAIQQHQQGEEDFPAPPQEAPVCKRRNSRTLAKEGKMLSKALASLNRFAHDYTLAEERATHPRRATAGSGSGSKVVRRKISTVSDETHESNFDELPPIVLGPATKRHIEVLLRKTMLGIAQKAIQSQQQEQIEQEEEEDSGRGGARTESVASSRSAGRHSEQMRHRGRALSPGGASHVSFADANTTPSHYRERELFRRLKDQEQARREMMQAMQQEERDSLREERALGAGEKRRTQYTLSSEATRMRHLLAGERRECLKRAGEAVAIKAQDEHRQRQERAAEAMERKRAEARFSRLAHEQVAMLREKLSGAVEQMAIANRWEVPEEVQLMFPE